ncbi:MAG: MerR family transcriptional regulator [Nocardioidaceae bacterium]
MFTIGDFASYGRVSVRMLRHYDAIGLLPPAQVDPATGYRSYDASQLARLNRIVALKDLGFTLEQVRSILDDKVGAEELRGMLRLRQAELQTQITADSTRLRQVEARLHLIEQEGAMPTDDVQIKQLPGVRLAELTGTADGFEPSAIGPVIQPLYEQLMGQLDRANVTPKGPALAYYEQTDGDKVVVHAGVPLSVGLSDSYEFSIVDLPPVDRAATIVHRGAMDDVMPTIQTLGRWVDANGHRSTGDNRELYLDYGCGDDPSAWTTELQQPLA